MEYTPQIVLSPRNVMFIDYKGIVDYVYDCCVYINVMISLFHICLMIISLKFTCTILVLIHRPCENS